MRTDINDVYWDQVHDAHGHPAIARVRSCATRVGDQNTHRNLVSLISTLGFDDLLEAFEGMTDEWCWKRKATLLATLPKRRAAFNGAEAFDDSQPIDPPLNGP